MKIGLCDDDQEIRTKVRGWIIANYPEIAPHDIHEFMSGEALVEYLRLKPLDILFLDCRMTGMDGIETAKTIRKQDDKLTIIILTDHSGYALRGYDVSAFNFILKKDFHKKSGLIFENALERIQLKRTTSLTFRAETGRVHMDAEDILYVEGEGKKKRLFLGNRKVFEVTGSFEEFENILKPHGFIRTHGSFLVNALYIKEFKSSKVEIVDGSFLPVSRKHCEEAKGEFLRYIN